MRIEERHLAMIRDILSTYDGSFYLFGSRATEKAHPFSDVDLFYTEAIPSAVLHNLKSAFEESRLPYSVDLVDGRFYDERSRHIMHMQAQCIQMSSHLMAAETLIMRYWQSLAELLCVKPLYDKGICTLLFHNSWLNKIYCPGILPSLSLQERNQLERAFSSEGFRWYLTSSQYNTDTMRLFQDRIFSWNTILLWDVDTLYQATSSSVLPDLQDFSVEPSLFRQALGYGEKGRELSSESPLKVWVSQSVKGALSIILMEDPEKSDKVYVEFVGNLDHGITLWHFVALWCRQHDKKRIISLSHSSDDLALLGSENLQQLFQEIGYLICFEKKESNL